MLVLNTMAEGESHRFQRELVEIGGAFRIPDVMRRSGHCSRKWDDQSTHLGDYQSAVGSQTALL